MGKMIAKAIAGKEFFYDRKSAHSVPAASAQKIADILNANNYQIKAGEVWHVYDASSHEMEYTHAGFQRFSIRKGRIYETR